MSSPLQEIIKTAQEIQKELGSLSFPGLDDNTAEMLLHSEKEKKMSKVLRNDIFSGGLESRWVNVDLLGAIVPYRDMEDECKDEKIEMLSSTCRDMVSTVQRQKNMLQKQRKQLTEARDEMIKFQNIFHALKVSHEMLEQENEELHVAYMNQHEMLNLDHHYELSHSHQGGIRDMEELD